MAIFKIFRETAVPTLPAEPYAIYVIGPAAKPDYAEIYITNADGSSMRRLLTEADVMTMISNAAAASSTVTVVDDIAARDALAPTTSIAVYVKDATGDSTVASGGASYLWDLGAGAWVKTSESESMDMVLAWANITGKPASTAAAIDGAVTASHTHVNKTELDKIGESSGQLTYGGQPVTTNWSSTGW